VCTAIKEYYVYPATIVKCHTIYRTCKGIHSGKLRTFSRE